MWTNGLALVGGYERLIHSQRSGHFRLRLAATFADFPEPATDSPLMLGVLLSRAWQVLVSYRWKHKKALTSLEYCS